MKVVTRSLGLALVVAALGPAACGDNEIEKDPSSPLAEASEAAQRTVAAGPARARVSVIGPGGRHLLAGDADFEDGYRLCAEIRDSPDGPQPGQFVWLEERGGTYGTLLSYRRSRGRECPGQGRWLDDHPPSLPLHSQRKVVLPTASRPETGAEDFIHAALLVLTRIDDAGIRASTGRCGPGTCYLVRFDFTRFDRRIERDEDLWALRPLFRFLGSYDAEVRVNEGGLVDRLRMSAPSPADRDPTPSAVTVEIALSAHSEAATVPEVVATAIE